jgi:hypothetical protein
MVIICNDNRRFEVTRASGGGAFYAQTHCACRSTMSSGEWLPTIDAAVQEAKSNIEDHERRCKIGNERRALVELLDNVGHAETLESAKIAVTIYLNRIRQKRPAAGLAHT